ncbi:8-oxo-dGTP pyrophosphatase MutT (NUDIX family) [Scopulibacillus daqui]|uniref:8-oxo-dGTP pyrophosphatase MutT (NUDIX family) n=1 Tax=Scopulibacillus daqui TaxID=1469162 RepID=A0ABS2Q442_9BACL|nr:CoA pyrophosphatase [Scopulibacillus daqui]MBM7647003.1 8-oxo-dGTP pyrophosphatase MutT (NUDIX family) [Scopulibacillus daqui]
MDLNQIKQKVNEDKGIIDEEQAKKSAVLIPLIEVNEEWHILFEIRSKALRSQPGDICFPGGRYDKKDAGLEDTAIRETSEELGINKSEITLLGDLAIYVPSPQMIVYPFVGYIHSANKIMPNEAEVDSVFSVPLYWLLQQKPDRHIVDLIAKPKADFPFHKIYGGKNYTFRRHFMEELFYDYHEHTIWGLTAKILTHFIEVIQKDWEN